MSKIPVLIVSTELSKNSNDKGVGGVKFNGDFVHRSPYADV